MKYILLATLLAAPGPILIGGGLQGPWTGDQDASGNDLKNLDDSYQDALTADTLPRVRSDKSQDAWPQSTTAANYVGAPYVISAGTGAKYATITNVGNLAGDTLVIHVMDMDGVVASGAANTLTEGTPSAALVVDCVTAGLTTAQCACAYYTKLAGGAIAGVSAQRTDATCSDSKFFVECSASTCAAMAWVYTSGGTVGMTLTTRAGGAVTVGTGGLLLYQGPGTPNLTTSSCLLGGGSVSIVTGSAGACTSTYAGLYTSTITGGTSLTNWTLGNSNLWQLASGVTIDWSSTTTQTGTKDLGIRRDSAGLLGITGGGATTVLAANYGRLGTATIDTSSAAAQTIFTVPAGRVAYPQRVVVRDPSAAITVAVLTLGFDAGCTNFLAAADLTALTGVTSTAGFSPANGALTVEGAAAAVFCVDTSAQEAAADTVVVDVFGELL